MGNHSRHWSKLQEHASDRVWQVWPSIYQYAKHDWKSWARCRRRVSCIGRWDRDSRETYRHAECPGHHRNCNGRERWKKLHQLHGNKSRDTCQQREVKQQESQATILEKYGNEKWQKSHPQIMKVIKKTKKTKKVHQKSTERLTKWNSSKNSKKWWIKQLTNCLKSQQEDILAKKKNLSHAWNRESVRKPYARKQKCFHQDMSAENLMISKTVELCWRQWRQTDVSKN